MPNWVFNTIDNYDEELYKKYKSEDRNIDFNKIIPEPEEITNTPSGSWNNIAKNVYKYRKFIEEGNNPKDYNNPLRKQMVEYTDTVCKSIGEKCIENPDKSINDLVKEDKNLEKQVDRYVDILGNNSFQNSDKEKIYDKLVEKEEEEFQESRQRQLNRTDDFKTGIETYSSLYDLGGKLIQLKEKYGVDNWYDWRIINWGTKWNAGDCSYDEEMQSMKFDTAWSVPEPILAKIAQDNPDKSMEVYSEEETGWFNEYELKNGTMAMMQSGQIYYDEETDGSSTKYDEDVDKTPYTYDQIKDQHAKNYSWIFNREE